jgi:hypothetical protein
VGHRRSVAQWYRVVQPGTGYWVQVAQWSRVVVAQWYREVAQWSRVVAAQWYRVVQPGYWVQVAQWYRVVVAQWYRVVQPGTGCHAQWYRVVVAQWYRVVQPGTAGQAGTRATEVQPRATPVTSSRGACVLRTACCRDGDVVFVVVVLLPSRLLHHDDTR